LHSGKDLAVSPFDFVQSKLELLSKTPRITTGLNSFRNQASLLAPLGLLRTGVTRYHIFSLCIYRYSQYNMFEKSVRTFLTSQKFLFTWRNGPLCHFFFFGKPSVTFAQFRSKSNL